MFTVRVPVSRNSLVNPGLGHICFLKFGSLPTPAEWDNPKDVPVPFSDSMGKDPDPDTSSSFTVSVEDRRMLTARELIWGCCLDLIWRLDDTKGNPVVKQRSSVGPDPLGPDKNTHVMCFPF